MTRLESVLCLCGWRLFADRQAGRQRGCNSGEQLSNSENNFWDFAGGKRPSLDLCAPGLGALPRADARPQVWEVGGAGGPGRGRAAENRCPCPPVDAPWKYEIEIAGRGDLSCQADRAPGTTAPQRRHSRLRFPLRPLPVPIAESCSRVPARPSSRSRATIHLGHRA